MVNIIQIDGIIGAGKTYFIKHVLVPALTKRGYRVKVIREPVDLWGKILPKFYKDPKRWATHFQMKALSDRIKVIKQTIVDQNKVDFYISERGVTSDRFFMEVLRKQKLVTKMEMEDYGEWWNMWFALCPIIPHTVIYLNTNIDLCMQRIVERARNGELPTSDGSDDSEKTGGVSRDYQLMLQAEHDYRYRGKTEVELITWNKTRLIEVIDVKEVNEWQSDIFAKLNLPQVNPVNH